MGVVLAKSQVIHTRLETRSLYTAQSRLCSSLVLYNRIVWGARLQNMRASRTPKKERHPPGRCTVCGEAK